MPEPSKSVVVSEEKFKQAVTYLKDHTDFFDPIYLTSDLYNPLEESDVADYEPTVATPAEMWEVVNFLQVYSDVDLKEMSRLRRNPAPIAVVDESIAQLIAQWYEMYTDFIRP